MTSACVNCNAPKAAGLECPHCGVIYAKAEAAAERRAAARAFGKPPAMAMAQTTTGDPAGDPVAGAPPIASPVVDDERVAAFLRSVYGWMAVALVITAFSAFVTIGPLPVLGLFLLKTPPLFWGLAIAELGIVWTLAGRVHKMSSSFATTMFVVYSALSGVTLSLLLLVYTRESVISMFLVTAGMFGACAMFGTTTRKNLDGWSQFLYMGLFGLVIASVVGLFVHSDALQFMLSYVAVIVFTGLSAYDAQRLKAMALVVPSGQTRPYAIVGALELYLDFINLFIALMRLFGKRR